MSLERDLRMTTRTTRITKRIRGRSSSTKNGYSGTTSITMHLLTRSSGRRTPGRGTYLRLSFLKCKTSTLIKSHRSDDDENEFGRPIYKPKNDPQLPALIKQRDEIIDEQNAKIEAVKKENKERRALGRPLLKEP